MGKGFKKIKSTVDSSGRSFFQYLEFLLDDQLMEKLINLSAKTEVYLFSGIIRNYFLKHYFKRDVDVVIGKEIDVFEEFSEYEITKNSFGGYKIMFPSEPLDLWFIKDTWAFRHSQTTLNFNLEKKIPETVFFNFSSIIYSLNNKEFFYTDDFVKFLKYRKLDYVFEQNPNYALCIVNTFYYADTYQLKISNRLHKFIADVYESKELDLISVQMKHFGKVVYENAELEKRIKDIHSLAD